VDTAVVISKNVSASQITFRNIELGRNYTLNYDGATTYTDKYGQALSLQQVLPGSIVDVTFMRARKRLNSLQITPDAFVGESVGDYELLPNGREFTMYGESYTLDNHAAVITQDGPCELIDLNPVDVLRVTGISHTIYGIYVERGHGYLRLENAEFFKGGWIQVDDDIVQQVAREMLIPVPEGEHVVTVSRRGSVGTEEIRLARGEEVTLDASVWVSEPQYGRIVFTTVPENARIYIDGEVIDSSEEQELSYGIHQMVVTADGYETLSRYIRVAQDLANLNIVLEKDGSAASVSENGTETPEPTVSENRPQPSVSENDTAQENPTVSENRTDAVSDNSASGNGTSDNGASGNSASENSASANSTNADPSDAVTTGQYRVYIDAPEGVEVYKDGTYLGICPVSFPKSAGNYVITLRKNGFQTRSYTIEVDSERKDSTYSFSELLPIS